jgi:hypothetical protein
MSNKRTYETIRRQISASASQAKDGWLRCGTAWMRADFGWWGADLLWGLALYSGRGQFGFWGSISSVANSI